MATTSVTFSDKPERPPTHGLCALCGFLAPLDVDGNVTGHLEIRVRRGPDGPEEYRTRFDCDGGGESPDPIHKEN